MSSFFVSMRSSVFLGSLDLRFETSSTAERSKTDEELREELIRKLIDRQLFGPSQQLMDLDPTTLPRRELPPGSVSSLYLMFVACNRAADVQSASRSTFYTTAKRWKECLVFRKASDHTMCVECQSLKTKIQQATVLASISFGLQPFQVDILSVPCLTNAFLGVWSPCEAMRPAVKSLSQYIFGQKSVLGRP